MSEKNDNILASSTLIEQAAEELLLNEGWKTDGNEWISPSEQIVRRTIELIFRFSFGTFISAHIFDFLFNPIWMHGYLWYSCF